MDRLQGERRIVRAAPDHRRGRPGVEVELQQVRPGVMADRVHHPLALGDQAHVEVGDEQALAARQWRHGVAPFRRDDGGAIAAA